MSLGRTGFVGRFKPLHNGGAAALDALCEASEHVTIGIGSANRPLSPSNPFTATESEEMIHAYLKTRHANYSVVRVDDFGHLPQFADGKRWRQEMIDKLGPLDWFVTGNAYVRDLLSDAYEITHPAFIIPPQDQVQMRATDVRKAMAAGAQWESMVPPAVARYIQDAGLDTRLRQQFSQDILVVPTTAEDKDTEKRRVAEG